MDFKRIATIIGVAVAGYIAFMLFTIFTTFWNGYLPEAGAARCL